MRSPEFDAWVSRAREVDILDAALAHGAVLKRAGREWIGPCPACGGADRFSVSPAKQVFNCRGACGGDVIGMVMHVMGGTFLQACEALIEEPPPGAHSAPLSEEAKQRLREQREAAERVRKRREKEEERRAASMLQTASAIWREVRRVDGTLAETYLVEGRGIPKPPQGWPNSIGFISMLAYDREQSFPALVARADNALGLGRGIQRIYLNPDKPKKAPVQPNKVSLGSLKGCAVRLGGIAETINVCEGLETGFAIWTLERYAAPVWCALGTSGLMGVDIPPEVKKVVIWPDGDASMRKKDNGYIPSEPAGLRAACVLRDRMIAEGRYVVVNPAPPPPSDYLNALKAMRELETA